MKIAVTGANGYLGGRLVEYLSKKPDYHIISVLRKNGSAVKSAVKGSEIFNLNWDDEAEMTTLCTEADMIIHCAGINAQDSMRNAIFAYEFNGIKTGKLAKIASENNVRKFIYFSTAHVYENPLSGIIREEDYTKNLHPYANSHKLGEDLVLHFFNPKMDVAVIRLSNSFGRPIHESVNCWQLIVNDLCRQAVTSSSLQLKTSGLQRRDFITLSEVSKIVDFLISIKLDKQSSLINVAGNWTPTILEMTELIRDRVKILFDKDMDIKKISARPGETSSELKIRTDVLDRLGYKISQEPTKELDELLQFCMDTFNLKSNKSIEN